MERKIKDGAGISGELSLWLLDPHSLKVEEKRKCSNLVLPTGLTWLASKVAHAYGPVGLSDIAVGTGTTAPVDTDVTLEAEVGRAKLSMVPWQGIGDSSHLFYLRAAFTVSEAVATLGEAAVFYGGTIFSRALISPAIPKPDNKILIVQWAYTFSAT